METFVVRIFVPAAGGETPIAGVVEHVGTGWSASFGGEEELLTAFRSWLEREGTPIGANVSEKGREG